MYIGLHMVTSAESLALLTVSVGLCSPVYDQSRAHAGLLPPGGLLLKVHQPTLMGKVEHMSIIFPVVVRPSLVLCAPRCAVSRHFPLEPASTTPELAPSQASPAQASPPVSCCVGILIWIAWQFKLPRAHMRLVSGGGS